MLEQIGKYRIDGTLGHGAMGVVYRGTDVTLERPVAIKTIHPHLLTGPVGEELLKRFKTEATAAARCQHGNIVTVYEFGQHDDMPYIVMEFVNGRGLDAILKEQPRLPMKRINAIFLGICRGLHYAHTAGIVHRDIKPANIMVLANDSVKLADFGIAKMPTSEQTQIGITLGTPSYMAPEQRNGGDIGPAADLFALGVLMFELLANSTDLPAGDQTVGIIERLPHSPKLKADKGFPRCIAEFLGKCLAAEPGQRYASVPQMLDAYKAALQALQGGKEAEPAAAGSQDATLISTQASTQIRTQIRPAPPPPVEETPLSEEERFIRRSLAALEATRALKAADPVLNPDWQEKITAALESLDVKARERAVSAIIAPKNIEWNPITKKFIYKGYPSLRELANNLSTPQLATLANKLDRSLAALRDNRNAMTIADTLEGGLSAIDRFDAEENVQRQKEKQRLRQSFLYDSATCVRQLDFDVPENRRNLTVDAIRTYIIEVFIKQQVMKYWFATTPIRTLQTDPDPLISKLIAHEAKVRRFEAVRTNRYLFLIGSVPRFDQNQYSVRRFLVEDTALGGRVYFFNILAVDLDTLHEAGTEATLRHNVSRMVTIERQLSTQIVELVEAFETCQRKYLLPLLFRPIEADGTNLEEAIEKRLLEYERNLCRLALGKVPRALREFVRGVDDFEYLFSGLKALLVELLDNVQDFSYLSASLWSEKTQELEYRIAAYIRLLEKRSAQLSGMVSETEAILKNDADPAQAIAEVRKAVEECMPLLEDLTARYKEAVKQAAIEMSSTQQFFNRVFKGVKREDPEELRKAMQETVRQCFFAIIRAPKKYSKVTVYLEFEDLAPAGGAVRHYAFPAGDTGLSLLPLLVQLPEKKDEFEPGKVAASLDFDLFRATQKWNSSSGEASA